MKIEFVEENLKEIEIEQGLSSSPATDTKGTILHYDDENEVDIDDLDNTTTLGQFETTGTLAQCQP